MVQFTLPANSKVKKGIEHPIKDIPENSKVDFYLQVHGIYSENAKLEMIQNIKKLNRVVSAYEICINDIASKENLIIK